MMVSAYRRLLLTLGRHHWFDTVIDRAITPAEQVLYRATGGRVTLARAGRWEAVPELLLITRGRTSGLERRAPVLYLTDDDRLFVVGSNFGRARHPAWSANLIADPAAEVIVDGERRRVRAVRASEDELRRMWPRMLEVWPSWARYRTYTTREFRGFFLERG
ncbi:MAG TPA: nitroreductase/quinone reductase family protein [Solirubrobacteraceae bacterium]|nr:nitroreductase/quinone reductase family protein [Solirubrobacteraceae bacterium]